MQIEKLIEKFYLKSLTDNEMVFLLNYLKDKEPQHEILSHYQEMWDKAGEYIEKINSKSIYYKIVREVSFSRVGLKSVSESPGRVGFRGYFRSFMKYAAVFILSFGLFWLTQIFLQKKEVSPPQLAAVEHIITVEVPYGSKSRVFFPDGSVVTLNSGSVISYSSSGFDSVSRSVFMTGEGFFNITKDPERPFYVNTPGLILKVLGTTFNVKAYLDDNIEETTLVTGKVEIISSSRSNRNEKSVVLKPNQVALFNKTGNDVQIIDNTGQINSKIVPVKLKSVNIQPLSKTEQIISWTDNKLIFDNESFTNMIKKIERWYDVKIIVNYPELHSARFTGKFDKETVQEVLNALITITPFSYKINHNIITVNKI